jgi:hypothetical protein
MKRKLKYILLALCVSFALLPKAVYATVSPTVELSLSDNNGNYDESYQGQYGTIQYLALDGQTWKALNDGTAISNSKYLIPATETNGIRTVKIKVTQPAGKTNTIYLQQNGETTDNKLTSGTETTLTNYGRLTIKELKDFELSLTNNNSVYDASYKSTYGTIEYSTDNKATWNDLSAAVYDQQGQKYKIPAEENAGKCTVSVKVTQAASNKGTISNGNTPLTSGTAYDFENYASISFTTGQTNIPVPSNAILLNISDNLGNYLTYDQAHSQTDPMGNPGIGMTLAYSYDNVNWLDFGNFASDSDITEANPVNDQNMTEYTYAFSNHDTVYLKVTSMNTGKMQSKALEGKTSDDGVYSYAGDVILNKVYTLNKKNSSYDLTYTNGTFSIIWSYTSSDASLKVTNGTVNVVSINNAAQTEVKPDENGVYMIRAKEDDEVVIQMIPNYGYQYLGGGFNDDDNLKSDTAVSTFTFKMPSRNLHLHALFQKVDNTVTNTSKKVASGDIAIADTEINSGNVDLSVADITLDATQISNFETAATSYDISSYLNISLDQVINKGTTDAAWTNQLKELKNPATVTLKLDEGVNGNEIVIVHEKHDGTFEIIPTTYDAAAQTISFTTTSFSNYAIASRTVDDTYKAPDTAVRDHTGAWMFGLLASVSFAGYMFGLRRKFSTK